MRAWLGRIPSRRLSPPWRVFGLAWLAFLALTAPQAAFAQTAIADARPNIVFVLTDDLSTNLVPYMPNVQAMAREGTSFSRYFVTDSLCCPSRSSILTGKFPHNTGVVTNQPPDGGFAIFNAKGNQSQTVALALQRAGYGTTMLGKYLNGYLPMRDPPPPGWTEWHVAGNGYGEFNYALNQNGKLVRYGNRPEDYLTDVAAGLALGIIKRAANAPFFIEIATFAPHGPYTPAPRDANKFPGLTAPRTPAFGARPDDAAPAWLKAIAPLTELNIRNLDRDFRKRVQSVQAVDKMVGDLRGALAAAGANNTYLVFSSDNGYHMGEYSLRSGKQTPFDSDIRVPLIVIGPNVAKGKVVEEIALNIDLAPTFAEIAGASDTLAPDGASLLGLLEGKVGPNLRRAALIEHRRGEADPSDPDAPVANGANPPTYSALRTENALYVEYQGGEVGYYDLSHDPDELRNVISSVTAEKRKLWHDALAASIACKGAQSCTNAARLAP